MGGDTWRYSRAESSSSSRAEAPRRSRSLDLARASATTSGEQSCDSDSVSDSDTASQHDETEWYSFNLSDAIRILDSLSSIQINKSVFPRLFSQELYPITLHLVTLWGLLYPNIKIISRLSNKVTLLCTRAIQKTPIPTNVASCMPHTVEL